MHVAENTPAKVAISDKFMLSMAGLPKQTAKKTMEFVSKFRQNPRSPGINYETINDAKDKQYRSVRIDQNYRGIIRAPDEGDIYLLLWVDKHDDAYDWARRHKCDVHPGTGTLQIYESIEIEVPEIVEVPTGSSTPEQPETPTVTPEQPIPAEKLFDLSETQLNAIGVPREMMRAVRALRSEVGLESLEGRLPSEAFEALYLLAAGSEWEEIEADYINKHDEPIDTTNIEAALERAGSQRSFWVIEDEMELQQMLNAPLDRWRVFLHPTQRKLVERSWNGPVRVLGGAGTGKTVVAMHRAKWLAKNTLQSGEKILFTTFTANLAMDIEANLRKICSEEELSRIEVRNIDSWVSDFLKKQKYPHDIVYENNEKLKRIWDKALMLNSEFPESFFKEEWERVVLPQRIQSLDEYKSAKRTGRGVALNRKQRLGIWDVFEEIRAQMHHAGLRTFEDATLDAADLLREKNIRLPYRTVLVDESQDMGPQALTLLRALVPEQTDDMFLVGDGHQRIYRRHAVMGQCGIRIVGRSRKLKINYRTTEETRRFASAILEGQPIDDMDGGNDKGTDYRSLTHGEVPTLRGFKTKAEEGEGILQIVRELIENEVDPRDICISFRTNRAGEYYASTLELAGIQTQTVKRKADERRLAGVRLATMHRVKGLEFRYVILAGISNGQVPLPITQTNSEDPVELRQNEISERALLHVAATRAVKGLYVTWHGEPSTFISQ
ncbi:MAG: DEAD/DEAH box helicase [Gammaproteobacteria bacterium]|nr:DEAD/DEAH box helicase [Gammaproteobacteria bacterium]